MTDSIHDAEPATRRRREGTVRAAAGAAAVVGASGFIGTHLVAALSTRGHLVVPFTRTEPSVTSHGLGPGLDRVRTVFYVAGGANPALAEADPTRSEADLAAFRALLDPLARLPSPPRVVLAGSGGTVYDPAAAPPYAESAPVAPTTVYGAGKLAMEQALLGYAQLSPVILRLANVYGPGQRTGTGQGVVAHWMAAAAQGRPLELFGDRATARDYVFVGDAVSAMVSVHETTRAVPAVLNIGSGVPTSLGALATAIRDVVDHHQVQVVQMPGRTFDRTAVWLAIDAARETLGWAPATDLEHGLRLTWESARPQW